MGKDLHQVADEVDALATEIATIVDHAVTEKRDLNRKERGRLRYITGRSRAISEELTDETDELERRGALGFDPRGARGGSGRSLGQFLAGEFRALAEGGSGQFIVPPDFAPQVWDRLAAASVGLSSGFTVVETDRDELHLPTVVGDAAASWTAEGDEIVPSDPALNEVVAIPRKLAALTVLTNELIDDSEPSVLDVVSNNLLRSLALRLDLGFFEGSGTPPSIRGLKNVEGIQSVNMGDQGAALTSIDPLIDAIALLEAADASATAIVLHPRSWSELLGLRETSESLRPLLVDAAGSPTRGVQKSILGVPAFTSSQLSVTETQGAAENATSIYVYQADQVVAVRRREARVELDRSRLFHHDSSELRAICRFDVVVPNPAAVVRIKGIVPPAP